MYKSQETRSDFNDQLYRQVQREKHDNPDANALNVDCSVAGELVHFCRTGECHSLKRELSRELCIGDSYVFTSYKFKSAHDYLYSFIEHGLLSDKFGPNQYAAYSCKDSSKQAEKNWLSIIFPA